VESWQTFVIQFVSILVPVAIAIVRQNRRISELMAENGRLRAAVNKLNNALSDLTENHHDLQVRYEDTLRQNAGMRDGF